MIKGTKIEISNAGKYNGTYDAVVEQKSERNAIGYLRQWNRLVHIYGNVSKQNILVDYPAMRWVVI